MERAVAHATIRGRLTAGIVAALAFPASMGLVLLGACSPQTISEAASPVAPTSSPAGADDLSPEPSAGTGAPTAMPSAREEPAPSTAADAASVAALRAVGGGTVRKVETGDEGVAYSVEVRGPDGRIVQVLLDRRFSVVAVRRDVHEAGGESAEEGSS